MANTKTDLKCFNEAQRTRNSQDVGIALDALKRLCEQSSVTIDLEKYEHVFGRKSQPDCQSASNEITRKVIISDRNSKCDCALKIPRDMKVSDFRKMMHEAFGFPEELQVIMTGYELLDDKVVINDKLKEYQGPKPIEVYLKDAWLQQRPRGVQTLDFFQNLLGHLREQQPIEETSENQVLLNTQLSGETSRMVLNDSTLGSSVDQNSTANDSSESWTCPRCTFENAGWRPGCEMCSECKPD